MKDLPYFLLLVKKNVVLWTIITTGSFANADLKDIAYDYWTKQFLQISHFSLDDKEKFHEVWITITEISTIISFRPSSSKYLDSTKYYFNEDTVAENSNSFYIADKQVSDVAKKLGAFDIGLDMPIHVTVGKSSVYGNYVNLTLYNKEWIEKAKKMRN